jgi:hypothetical protein
MADIHLSHSNDPISVLVGPLQEFEERKASTETLLLFQMHSVGDMLFLGTVPSRPLASRCSEIAGAFIVCEYYVLGTAHSTPLTSLVHWLKRLVAGGYGRDPDFRDQGRLLMV